MELNECLTDWYDLQQDYKKLETTNQSYLELLESLEGLQKKCEADIKHQRYRMSQITKNVGLYRKSVKKEGKEITDEDQGKIAEIDKEILKRKAQLHEIEQSLPKKNSLYLKVILGDVNVSILNRNDKVRYKDEYEKFKLILNAIALGMGVLNYFINFRALELIFMFLLVWYYCTLTIRESILKVNGSRIKGWWRAHHFISTVSAGILLIWPQGEHWQMFRTQFILFNCYISVVQYLQFRYQKGVLYRLKALGVRHGMDITIEGFHSWMWRGLGFLMPFLFVGYIFQLYNAYALLKLSFLPNAPWQPSVLCLLFFVLFVGNTTTTLMVIPQKMRERVKERYRLMSLSWSLRISQQIRGARKESERVAAAKNDKSETDGGEEKKEK